MVSTTGQLSRMRFRGAPAGGGVGQTTNDATASSNKSKNTYCLHAISARTLFLRNTPAALLVGFLASCIEPCVALSTRQSPSKILPLDHYRVRSLSSHYVVCVSIDQSDPSSDDRLLPRTLKFNSKSRAGCAPCAGALTQATH